MNLFYDIEGASRSGIIDHPQKDMHNLGIVYQHSTPQSIVDGWQFWNCTSIPEKLPSYISKIKGSPYHFIGHGLSPELAKIINDWKEGEDG